MYLSTTYIYNIHNILYYLNTMPISCRIQIEFNELNKCLFNILTSWVNVDFERRHNISYSILKQHLPRLIPSRLALIALCTSLQFNSLKAPPLDSLIIIRQIMIGCDNFRRFVVGKWVIDF